MKTIGNSTQEIQTKSERINEMNDMNEIYKNEFKTKSQKLATRLYNEL